jgi:parallel beta-helix repeat protein
MLAGSACSEVWYVRPDGSDTNGGAAWTDAFQTIRKAVERAEDGDEIWVAAGLYLLQDTPSPKDYIAVEKAISIYGGFKGTDTERGDRDWVTHATTVDGNGAVLCFLMRADATIDGLIITNGFDSDNGYAGGIRIERCSPTIANCVIRDNKGKYNGGGICNYEESCPTISNCTFSGNSAGDFGGAIYNYSFSSPTILNSLFYQNRANDSGGAIYNYHQSSPTITNCTFSENVATTGGGICNYHASPIITNSILWNDVASEGPEIYAYGESFPHVSHSDIQGGFPGAGNIDEEPHFVDPGNGDFHLTSASPCIDTGDPDAPGLPLTDWEGDLRDERPDMGADEFVDEPLRSLTNGEPKGAFGSGYQTDEVTEPETWRWAEYFYGFKGIDEIKWMRDGCGQCHNYAIGWHEGDLAEYLLKFGGEYDRLILRGKSDRPGPVLVNVYIDGQYQTTIAWDRDNDCNQDVVVDMAGIEYGPHAIAIEFANDYWNPRAGEDRNLYLDGLRVTKAATMCSITGGEPRGSFETGCQTDEVTEPGRWRWSRFFYGFDGIDEIKWMKDSCGQTHNYAIGWHQGDLIEYLMEFGGDYRHLTLRGKADRPGPVMLNIYIDTILQGTASWENDDNSNQDVTVEIPAIAYGPHAIAIEFAKDHWNPYGGADEDRNMYLDGLMVSKPSPGP